MNRREFLNLMNMMMVAGSRGLIPGLSLGSAIAGADEAPQNRKFIVMMRANYGWDVTLGLDPQIRREGTDENDMFIEYRPEDILSAGGLRLAPACKPLLPYAGDLAAVNGIFMSDANVSHEANRDYISTGNSEGGSPDLPVEVGYASQVGPFGVIFNRSLKRSSRVVMPTSTSNLESLRNSANMVAFADFLGWASHGSDFMRSQQGLLNSGPERQKFISALDSMKDELANNTDEPGRIREAAVVLASAFVCGGAAQGLLDITADLDTHSGHPGKHLTQQTMVWSSVAEVFRIFKKVPYAGGSLFDSTTFIAVSDFSRTPALNASKGKDHNPLTNSVLLAGYGIRGGQSFGISNLISRKESKTGEPRHCGGLVNYATGAPARSQDEAKSKDFQFVFPENVVATVIDALGVDRAKFSSVAPTIASLSPLLKKA